MLYVKHYIIMHQTINYLFYISKMIIKLHSFNYNKWIVIWKISYSNLVCHKIRDMQKPWTHKDMNNDLNLFLFLVFFDINVTNILFCVPPKKERHMQNNYILSIVCSKQISSLEGSVYVLMESMCIIC